MPKQFFDPFYYEIPGIDTAFGGLFISGNIPDLSNVVIIRSLLLLLLLVIFVAKVWNHPRVQSKMRGLPVMGRVCVIALTVVSFFALLEMALSFPYFQADHSYMPDPITFWSAHSGTKNALDATGKCIATSDLTISGIFDTSHPGEKQKDTQRIVFLGDSQSISSTEGQYSLTSYPKQVEIDVNAKVFAPVKHTYCDTINAGMSGFSSWQGWLMLRQHISELNPDVVVEAFGYHDSNGSYSRDSEVITDNPTMWRLRKLMYSSQVCLLIRSISLRCQAANVDSTASQPSAEDSAEDPPTCRVGPGEFAQNLTNMTRLVRQHGAKMVFLIEPNRKSGRPVHFALHRKALLEVSENYDVPVIDIASAFARLEALSGPGAELVFCDNIHFTKLGHRLAAQLVEEKLVEMNLLKPGSNYDRGGGPSPIDEYCALLEAARASR